MPSVGDEVRWNDIRIEVVDLDGHRIDKVLVTFVAPQGDDAAADLDDDAMA